MEGILILLGTVATGAVLGGVVYLIVTLGQVARHTERTAQWLEQIQQTAAREWPAFKQAVLSAPFRPTAAGTKATPPLRGTTAAPPPVPPPAVAPGSAGGAAAGETPDGEIVSMAPTPSGIGTKSRPADERPAEAASPAAPAAPAAPGEPGMDGKDKAAVVADRGGTPAAMRSPPSAGVYGTAPKPRPSAMPLFVAPSTGLADVRDGNGAGGGERAFEKGAKAFAAVPAVPPEPRPTAPADAAFPAFATTSPWEAKTQAALRAFKEWFVVGEEYRPRHVPLEYAVAVAWLMRGAALMLVGGLAYFLQYAYDRQLLRPEAWIGAVALIGLAAVGTGVRMSGRKYRAPGVGLAGIGVGVLIGDVFAASALHHLIGQRPAFGLVLLVVAGAAALAVRLRAQAVMMVGLFGGFLAPAVLDTGSKNLPGLFGYLAALLGGVVAVSFLRQWRPTQWFALLGTMAIYFGAMYRHYAPDPFFASALAAACGYYGLFMAVLLAPALAARRPFTLPDVLGQVLATVVWIATAVLLVRGWAVSADRPDANQLAAAVPAGAALLLWALYFLARPRLAGARPLRAALEAQIAVLAALAGGLYLGGNGLNLFWIAQAAAMLWLARRNASPTLWGCADAMFGVAAWRILFFETAKWTRVAADYSTGALDRGMTLGVLALGLAAGWFALRRAPSEAEAPVAGRIRGRAPWLAGLAMAVLFVHSTLEAYNAAHAFAPNFRHGAVSLAWGLWAFGAVWFGLARRAAWARRLGLTLFVVAAGKVLLLDLAGLATIYRVAALVGMGLAMLAGAMIYARFSPAADDPGEKGNDGPPPA